MDYKISGESQDARSGHVPITTAVIGRQPIVDRACDVIGYELLFRALETSEIACRPVSVDSRSGDNGESVPDGDAMSADVFLNTMGIGLARVIGSKTAFCNADRGVLTGKVPITLPPDRTVIEVLESVTVDDEVLHGCRRLRELGYRLAADDFRWFDGAERLIELVDIVKVDLRISDVDEVRELIDRCQPFGVQLLAEKVETDEELARFLDLGFDLFQGYLLGRPRTIASPALGPSRHGVLHLTAALMRAEANFDQLEGIVRSEPALSYKLLQLAAIGRLGEAKRRIRTIREALVTVGLNRIRAWLPLLLLRPSGASVDSSLPTVLSRARLAESLAEHLSSVDTGFAFAAGMLSGFDLLLGISPSELPDTLEVPDDLREAAFDGTGDVGRLVAAVIDYQRAGIVPVDLPGIDPALIDRLAAHSFAWAVDITDQLDAPAA
ncbi:MAG: hypothetical protein BGO26_05285 [Actinobacteria bacterium 69-20]|nr:MAG: hypothetical protein BGO26_05285 [Actinobacteria bacterium 69-20]